ncbi:hypothetical protein [Actinoallomurus iriomotensis]|uniref:Secreted protein n=1 Tax=Actinoallomurus iriomotensis TaxID=478107 RepID=A0A9W6W4S1_9ACTN|nr:hypothetical protein [Actinoallomurus iriomotensis]GLY91325.1 hypothetical protein Airi02_092540 [Actinoallomurus iriomotensis]
MTLGRSVLTLAAVAGLAVSGALTAPAASAATAAYPSKSVVVQDGSGSWIGGTLTFYGRSVGFDGDMRSIGCRRAWLSAYDAAGGSLGPRSSSTHCDSIAEVPTTLPANVAGGAAYVWVCLDDATAVHTACERRYAN